MEMFHHVNLGPYGAFYVVLNRASLSSQSYGVVVNNSLLGTLLLIASQTSEIYLFMFDVPILMLYCGEILSSGQTSQCDCQQEANP